jgi:hypothetical protein
MLQRLGVRSRANVNIGCYNVLQSHRRAEQADGSGCGEHWVEAKTADVEKEVILIAINRRHRIAANKTSNSSQVMNVASLESRLGQQFVTVNTMGQTFVDSSMVKGHIGDAVDDRRR